MDLDPRKNQRLIDVKCPIVLTASAISIHQPFEGQVLVQVWPVQAEWRNLNVSQLRLVSLRESVVGGDPKLDFDYAVDVYEYKAVLVAGCSFIRG